MKQNAVCLINDSFPPTIDGVANVVANYANELSDYTKVVVATPFDPKADDSNYSYPVYRYPSIASKAAEGYRAGLPFSPRVLDEIRRENIDIIHAHCPITSAFMARSLRRITNKPIVLTWHTKYDIDVQNAIRSKILQNEAIDAIINNVNVFDEVWTVSKGAGENLKSLGYKGDYIVMENGVDLPKEKLSKEKANDLLRDYSIKKDVPILLFVGRTRWYKGIRITLDALKVLKDKNIAFQMYFVGDGSDKQEIMEYCTSLNLDDCVTFYDGIHDRELLRAWYSIADLFIFPSTFDTNGLVVREAAACGLASVLVKGSCAAEDTIDNHNGYLIEENYQSLSEKLIQILPDLNKIHEVGYNAQNEIYISWSDAVKKAYDRYQIVIDHYNYENNKQDDTITAELFDKVSLTMEKYKQLYEHHSHLIEKINNEYALIKNLVEEENSKNFTTIHDIVNQIKEKL